MIGNDETLRCSGVCADVELVLDGHKFLLDLFVLPIKGADLVLATQWLSTLGPILMDYKALTLSFTWQGNSLILRGKQRHLVEPINFHQLKRLLAVDSVAETFHLYSLAITHYDPSPSSEPIVLDEDIRTTLDSFATIFAPSTQLPPPRPHDHHIPLQPRQDVDLYAYILTFSRVNWNAW
ncbi:hypothetical protein Pint_00647 [Pistacia integerrima]|uniref:Uncharacterized protein n=1 Tax=Pistacia integerrima TaxID=434235 RepID=A0ACC0ZLQ4_9ROSI|nr:hypothetical protein Pint_00647 [Pistacia integerrima]